MCLVDKTRVYALLEYDNPRAVVRTASHMTRVIEKRQFPHLEYDNQTDRRGDGTWYVHLSHMGTWENCRVLESKYDSVGCSKSD